MRKYQWQDGIGNTQTIIVRDDDTVVMHNQHRIATSLANVAFLTDANGTAAQAALVRIAARRGLAYLRDVTKLDWKQVDL